jgi:site-specific DNA-methyltransferase (adenine-specific)
MKSVILGDAAVVLKSIPDEKIDLVFIDPPFNTGNDQKLLSSQRAYADKYGDFKSFINPILKELCRISKKSGSIFILLDYREVHYVKVWMDDILGREAFKGEIIWHFETGGQSKTKWSNKHNTVLWYSKSTNPIFNFDAVPSEVRKAPKPGYEGSKKLSSVWNINMSTTDSQRVGYPSQKPEQLLENIISVHSKQNDVVLDCFAGSGTTGAVAKRLGRRYILIDSNPESISVINERLKTVSQG